MSKPEIIDDPSKRDEAIAALARALAGELDEHPSYAMLEQVVDRTADDVTDEIVRSHLEVCPQCAEELRDLMELAGHAHTRAATAGWLAIAAAIIIAVLAGGWWMTRAGRAAAPHSIGKAVTTTLAPTPDEFSLLVESALRTGRIEKPGILRELRLPADVLRDPGATSSSSAMTPSGVVIESVTPMLLWKAAGERYVVSIFDGRRRVAHSGVLSANQWTVSPPLARGRTYGWQVEVRRSGSVDIMPAPPAAPALFHVLDEGSASLLAGARRRHRDDHLILGVLYARMGMQDAAVDELRTYAAQHPQARNVAALADSVARW